MTSDLLPEEVADQITAALDALGDTPGSIERRLIARGVIGTPNDPCRCVIANHLRTHGPVVHRLAVLDGVIDLHTATGANLTVSTPDAVAEFVGLFDNGYYPRLTAKPQRDPVADPGTTDLTEVTS